MSAGGDEPASRGDGGASLVAVRAELRGLGYLGDPLQRWVLGDVVRRPRVLAPALRAAVLAALLAGLVLTGAQVSWSRVLASHPLDVAVVGVLSALLLLPVMLMSVLVVASGVLLTGSRPRATGHWVARAVGVSGFAYGAWWWWQRAASRGGVTAGNLAVLAMLAIIAIVVARIFAVAAAALALARGPDGVADAGPASAPREQRSALLGALLAAAVAVSVPVALRPAAPSPGAKLTRPAMAPRVAVVAVDGLVAADLATLASASAPAKSWLDGAARRELDPGPRGLPPPVVWTTVATGRDPLHHGVRSLLVDRVPGIDTAFASGYGIAAARAVLRSLLPQAPPQEPVSEALRREKAFFEVAAEAGFDVVVANWWATYPAAIARGSVVSDRALAGLLASGNAGHAVYPAEWGRALELAWPALARDVATPGPAPERALAQDRFHARLASERFFDTDAALLALYLQAPDVLWSATPERAGSELDRYLGFIGGVVAGLGAAVGADGVVVLASHPGRGRPGSSGVLAIAGPGVVAGDYPPARLEDVAPTVLDLLGLPLSEELRGQALLDAFDTARVSAPRPRTVLSYGGRSGAAVLDDDTSAEAARERLRSLGYVSE